jgi:hypothetical protein
MNLRKTRLGIGWFPCESRQNRFSTPSTSNPHARQGLDTAAFLHQAEVCPEISFSSYLDEIDRIHSWHFILGLSITLNSKASGSDISAVISFTFRRNTLLTVYHRRYLIPGELAYV